MTKYTKPIDNSPTPWRASAPPVDCSEFVLRITLGEMPLEDGFWLSLPDELARVSLQELFDRVFPADPSLQQGFLERLDVGGNPDLPDMYDALVEIFVREELGQCTVDTYVNNGPKLECSASIDRHLVENDRARVLDLVVEQRFSAIRYAARRGDFPDQDAAVAWMRSRVLLYFLGEGGFVLQPEPIDPADARLLPIAQSLVREGLIEQSAGTGSFEVTEPGYETIDEMTASVENALERYEAFADVLYDAETGECDFGTGAGLDLRIPVYEAESLSAMRTVFLVELCDGDLARMDDWREAIQDREFFESLLLPVADRPLIGEDDLDAVIDAGFAFMDDMARQASLADEDAQLRRSLD